MMPKIITETSESGVVRARYIISSSSGRSGGGGGSGDGWRTDIVLPKESTSLWASLLAVFLPAGYPHSVTDDYMWYQIYDSLQAFSSSIAGLLSSRAVLEGVGVGDASASPTAAILLSVLQESMGRVATILFAHKLGTSLEPECKMYRLAADIFNDSAMVLDCLSPALPKTPRVVLLGFSSVLRALCGVAAGSSKASLSAHFAKWGNLGELNAVGGSQILRHINASALPPWSGAPFGNYGLPQSLLFLSNCLKYHQAIALLPMVWWFGSAAGCAAISGDFVWLIYAALYLEANEAKDSSQETVISLMGMLAGSVVVARISSPIATWSLLLVLLSIHLAMNYAAVRAVSMQNLNRQRANMVLSTFFDSGTALTPNEVSNQERIFEWGGVLRWKGSAPMAKAKIGGPLQEMISSLGPTHSITGATRDTDSVLVRLFQIYAKEEYLLWYSLSDHTVYFVLKDRISVRSQLKAWAQGLVLVHRLAQVQLATSATEKLLESVESSLLEVSNCWPTCMERLKAAGWDLDIASLETASGTRINVDTKS